MNKVILKGNAGSDVDFRYVGAKNMAKAAVSLAVKDKMDPKNSEKVYWAYLVGLGKVAELFRDYVSKGQEILVEGRMARSTWEKDGVKHHKDEVVVESLYFCGAPKRGSSKNDGPDPDIPF
jgi:single-strand DNA-binding protein